MNQWIEGRDGVLLNLNNMADVIHKKQDNSVIGYTTSGFGIVLYKGSKEDCERVLSEIKAIVSTIYSVI
jgi:hypothetical protein